MTCFTFLVYPKHVFGHFEDIKLTKIQVKKAKTHYTNYRNQGVNPHDLSRSLHRQWFDVIQFPTSRELENMSSTGTEVAPVQSAKCHGCQA